MTSERFFLVREEGWGRGSHTHTAPQMTPDEISRFQAGPVACLEDAVTTNGATICGSVVAIVDEASATITVTSNR